MADTLYKYGGIDPTERHYKVTEDLKSYRCDKVGDVWVDTQLFQPSHMIQQDPGYTEYTIPTTKKKSK